MLADLLSAALIVIGLVFFTAGTLGLLRFGEARSQLHALTKADNLGLGLVLFGVAFYVGELSTSLVLLLVWLLALGAASVSAQALAGEAAHASEGQGRERVGPQT